MATHLLWKLRKLREQKDTLFNLTQEQANARLSVKKLRDEYSLYENDGKQVVATNQKIGVSLSKALGVIGGVTALKQLGSEIIRVRGEFQSMQTAIETMVGKDIAGQLVPQIKELAKISPLTMSDMVGAEKMMLGFNIKAEDTIKYLKALSDISMGESSKFNSLTLAFSQMSAAGKLMGQDLNQMINAGFNPLQVIAEKSGKSIATLKDEMLKGAISAEMVQQAFIDATSAGGKFYGMSENASKTINGQISMMQDALDNALNEIGQKSEGVIMKGIQTTTSLIENYETVGKVLIGLIATYGVYKTAVIANIVLTQSWTAATQADAIAKGIQTFATKAQTLATGALNAVMKLTPWGFALTGAMAIAAAMWAFNDSTTEAEKAQKRLNESIKESEKGSLSEQRKLAKLKGELSALTVGTREYNTIKDKIVQGYGKYYDGLDAEISKVGLTESAYRKLTEAIKESFASRQYEKFSTEQEGLLDATMADNLAKIQERVYDKLGDEVGAKIYTKIRNGIIQGSIGLGENIFELTGLDKELQDSLDKVAGKDGGLFDVTNRSVEKYISDIIRVKDLTDEMDRKARERFGIDDTSTNSGKGKNADPETVVTRNKAYWEKQKKDAEAVLDSIASSQKKLMDAGKFEGIDETVVESYKDNVKKLKEAEKELAVYNSSSKQKSAADKLVKKQESLRAQNEKIAQIERKQAIDRQRQTEDLENQLIQSQIDAMDNGYAKEQAQRELNNKKEIQSLQRQKDDYIHAYIQAQKDIFDAQEELKAQKDSKYKKKTFDSSSISVDTTAFDAVIENISQRQLNDKIREQEESWNDYLIKFGNYQQKRKALIEKYDKEISESKTAGEAAILEKEKDNALDQLDNSVKNSATLMGQLFADASQKSANEIQKIIEKAELLMQYLGAVKDEQGNTQIGGKSVSKKDILDLGISENTLQNLGMSTEEVEALRSAIDKLKGDLGSKSPFKLFESQISTAAKKIAQGGKENIAQGISEIGTAITAFSPDIAQFGKDLGNIFGSDDFSSKVAGLADAFGGLGQTAAGVGQIMSGDIVGGAMSAVSGISSIVSALDGLFGANYDKYNKAKEEYESYISVLYDVIEKQKEMVASLDVQNAVNSYDYAKSLIEKSAEAARILGKERLNAGASAGSHSIGVRIVKGMSSEGWDEAEKALGSGFNKATEGRMTGLFDLSVDQLEKLQAEAPTFWAKLDDDVRTYLALGDQVYRLTYLRSASFGLSLSRTFSKISIKFNEPNPANRR